MLFTKASEYALLSLILISQKPEATDALSIANELGISKSFLAKILQNLARAKILHSYKGANGGFTLAVAPEELSVLRIIESAEKRRASVFDCSADASACPGQKAPICQIWPMFTGFQAQVDDMLESIKLSDIIKAS
ncbi:Rrf2 family transcriptional regulator [Campylobacter sp. 19-13652]|uniref:Rrf2 family transcriptional regulator n=1 Tax=Campylobacter sp. 19-13652 TaxID=2840180 RepID=UPI001C756861|nr:Rrf2 family transcriptional regulator [Campylobacter sp. 19-13652]BCX79136.1 transcriptional regulator [Campylobacter sp. 19-13652]